MNERHIASVSFGKDSLAMLLLLISKKMPLDEVVFYDTGMEFSAIYKIRDFMAGFLKAQGIKYTELHPEQPFEYLMFEKPVNGKNGPHKGYSWCGGRCRWGTTAKLAAIDRYCKGAKQYVGIAYDEPQRAERARQAGKLTPLADWEMTEQACLAVCLFYGFTYEERPGVPLYKILDRVSCWCCANKNLRELRNYRKHLPEYWDKLKQLQSRTDRPFKSSGSIFELEERFKNETPE